MHRDRRRPIVRPTAKEGHRLIRPRVVLAEDHPAIATQLRALLASEYEVIATVHDGRALVEAAGATLPDAIVSDIAMPGLSGLAAADLILAIRPESRIVFVTVQEDRAVIWKAMASGALGYVVKCDAGEELNEAVRAVLLGGRYLSANARRSLGNVELALGTEDGSS